MLKVFGRKKTSDGQGPPTQSRLTPSAPRPLGIPSPRGEYPPPLYARFATRGESFDSSSTRNVSPNPAPSTENLREEYTRNTRIYGNESVTRFGSGIIIANASSTSSSRDISPTSTGDESMAVPVVSKWRGTPSWKSQMDALVEASPPRAVAGQDRSSSGPRIQRKLVRKQPSVADSDLFTPPRAPGMYTKPSSSSASFDTSIEDMDSLLEKPMPLPPSSQTSVRILGRTGASTTNLTRPDSPSTTLDKDLPPPPPPKSLPSSSERPMSVLSSTTFKPSSTPPAASLVHPAFKRSLPSTPSSASLVHPSQRLQSLGALNMSNTGLSNPISPSNAFSESPQAIIPRPPLPVSPTPAPESSQTLPSTPISKPVPNGTSPKPTSTLPTSTPPPTALGLAVAKARRRMSAELGTYDISTARKERELILNSPSDESPRTDSKRSSIVLAGSPAMMYQAAMQDQSRSPSTTPVKKSVPPPPPPPGAAIPMQLKDRYRAQAGSPESSSSASTRQRPASPHQIPDLPSPTKTHNRAASGDTVVPMSVPGNRPSRVFDVPSSSPPLVREAEVPHSTSQTSSVSSTNSSTFSDGARSANTQRTSVSLTDNGPVPGPYAHRKPVTARSATAGVSLADNDPIAGPSSPRKPIPAQSEVAESFRSSPRSSASPRKRNVSGSGDRRAADVAMARFSIATETPNRHSQIPTSRHAPRPLPSAPGPIGMPRTWGGAPSFTVTSPLSPAYNSGNPYPIIPHLLNPDLLSALLMWFPFRDALPLFSISMFVKKAMEETRDVKEAILEKYLRDSIGYRKWNPDKMGKKKEPLSLTLRDLNSYMRGVSLPPHHYSMVAENFLSALAASTSTSPNAPRASIPKTLTNQVRMMASSTRAFTKVVIRLRSQADAEESHSQSLLAIGDAGVRGRTTSSRGGRMPLSGAGTHPPTTGPGSGFSKRSQSPAFSFTSYDRFGPGSQGAGPALGPSPAMVTTAPGKFKSPLYRSGHAALLRVFVPSPEGAWLSDASVMECERELKRAGVVALLKPGDVVHDLAAGDEGNTGRLIWDGNYLIDLDYTYSQLGEVPKYIDSLSFPPSYFHKIVRSAGNPIVHMDLSPFACDIANNIQLIQDRVKTDTPQGKQHTVVRYIHRARFRIRPGVLVNPYAPPIAGPDGQPVVKLVDSGWHGVVVIDTEGTNEGLADLQARVGNSVTLLPTRTDRPSMEQMRAPVAPPRAYTPGMGKTVFRLMREQSRPGEIWLRCVQDKDRLM